jgi:carboxylesterase type B
MVFWHGGGFTLANAGQFYYQTQYFSQRGAVWLRPEYRIRDLGHTIPTAVVGTVDPDKFLKLDIFVSNFAGLAENANSSDW